MNRRKFLSLSGTTTIGLGMGLAPQFTHAATGQDHSLNAQTLGLKPNLSSDQSSILQAAIHQAAQQKLPLFIPAGSYVISDVNLIDQTQLIGSNGQTTLVQTDNQPILTAHNAADVKIESLNFEGNLVSNGQSQLIAINQCKNFHLSQCQLYNGNGNGLDLYQSSGQIIQNIFRNLGQAAIVSNAGNGFTISQNEIYDMGNNGILIWQPENAKDGSIINQNRIYNISSNDGGSGQNGNGVNIFLANNVIASDNQFDNCYYSAVRINAGNDCQIINNNCTNIGEVALYAEFGFNAVIINNNLVDGAGSGISITNLNNDGHLAVCKGNLLRNINILHKAGQPNDSRNYGIAAEGDALIEGNVIENATQAGITGGYGQFLRNISVLNNMIKDCGYGIAASIARGAGKMAISNNSINNPLYGAIVGFEWEEATTDDLINENQSFDEGSHENLHINNNVLT